MWEYVYEEGGVCGGLDLSENLFSFSFYIYRMCYIMKPEIVLQNPGFKDREETLN